METTIKGEDRPMRYASGYYARWYIMKVISELEGGVPQQELLHKYKIKTFTLRTWIVKYASAAYKKKIKRVTAEQKNFIVRAVLDGRMTVQEAKVACNLAMGQTIERWIKDYQQGENIDLAVNNLPELGKKTTKSGSTEQEQIKALQEQLAQERLKVAALNTLIDVAEEQLKINIRKKPGARQS